MNSLKTLVIVALLAAVGYAVYVSITRSPHQATDPGVAQTWPSNAKAQIPGAGAATPQSPGGSSPAGTPPSGPALPFSAGPSLPAANGTAARNTPTTGGTAGLMPPLASPRPSVPPAGLPPEAVPPAYPGPPPGYPAIGDKAAAPGAAATPGNAQSPDPETRAKFASFMETVQRNLDEGRLDEGLRALSMVYNNSDLPPAYAQQLTTLLDQLAGTVIYSRQHLLEAPYKVQPGDRLDQIAQKYNVPWELLARINGIRDPGRLTPGQELKVVRGPFSAVISLDRYEMTLMLDGRYAGRFRIGIGRDPLRLQGTYKIRDKIAGPIYCGPDGANIAAGDPNNPLGKFLLDLGNQVGIHGTNDPRSVGRTGSLGVICMSDRDIDDLFGILSIDAQVVIQK